MDLYLRPRNGTYLLALAGLLLVTPMTTAADSADHSNGEAFVWTGALPMSADSPYARVFHPENIPSDDERRGFPKEWRAAYSNNQNNAAFPPGSNAPDWLKTGVTWNYAEARAWPLSNKSAFAQRAYGERAAPPVQTQHLGNALGVSAVDGVIYAESDDMFAYAINARTGKLIWRTSPIANNMMGNPLVIGDLVYLSAGSVNFNFSHVLEYKRKGMSARGEDVNYNGIIAVDRRTGEFRWAFLTKGETMTTPAFGDGQLYVSTGAGNLFAIDAKTGEKVWKTHLGGIANMSNPLFHEGRVYLGMSVKPFIYSVDAATGKVVWKKTIKGAVNTGLGDVPPALADGILVDTTIADKRYENGQTTVITRIAAKSAKDGRKLWVKDMGRGPMPPAFKGGVPMIHDGVVYVGSPVNNVFQARDLKTGKMLWTWHIPDPSPSGEGRGPATYYQGTLYIATKADVFALNPKTGKVIGQTHIGGRFGLVQPTIVGGQIYLANSWDWIHAVPVGDVHSGGRVAARSASH